jgi:hypothetical protein
VEIVPPFGKATADMAKSNTAEQKVHLSVFMISPWCVNVTFAVGFRVATKPFEPTYSN